MAEFTTQTVLEAALLAARKPLSIREMRRLFSDELSAKTVTAGVLGESSYGA